VTDAAEPPTRALAELVARVARTLAAGGSGGPAGTGGDDAAVRSQVAVEVEQLQAIVAQTEQQRAPGAPMGLAGFDLAQVSGALAAFAEWLRTPTRASEAQAERAMAELQATLGPIVGWDPAREDAARRAQYRQEARATLDEIFRDKPDKPGKP
jgi:hypothetical protein